MKKNKKYLLAILLFAVVATAWYFYFNKSKKINKEDFKQQGQSEINAGEMIMKVWDYSAADGDSVQILFDGEMLADSLALEYEPVEYKLGALSAGEHWIGVKAINEGMMGAASPHVRISNGKDSFDIEISAWIDSVATSWKIIIK